MKKIISIILTIIIASLALTSCDNGAMTATSNTTSTTNTTATTIKPTIPSVKKEYNVLVTGFSDGGGGAKKDYIDLDGGSKRKDPAPIAALTFNGVTYNGKYSHTRVEKFYNIDRDVYTYDDGKIEIKYTVHEKSGKIDSVYTYLLKVNKEDYIGRRAYSKEDCIRLAKEYMKQYIPNIDEYILEDCDESTGHKGYNVAYHLKFREYIGDLALPNDAFVDINMYGDIVSFDYYTAIEDVEAFKASGYLESVDWDSVTEAINARACEVFATDENIRKRFDFFRVLNNDVFQTEKSLARMADGRYALQCTAHVFLTTEEFPDLGTIYDVELFLYLD